jgi:hypothetical protein
VFIVFLSCGHLDVLRVNKFKKKNNQIRKMTKFKAKYPLRVTASIIDYDA